MANINFNGVEVGFPNLKNGQSFNVPEQNVVNIWLHKVKHKKRNAPIVEGVLKL